MNFWKRQNFGDIKKISGFMRLGKVNILNRKINRQNIVDILRW
jgi:hypothetical protein